MTSSRLPVQLFPLLTLIALCGCQEDGNALKMTHTFGETTTHPRAAIDEEAAMAHLEAYAEAGGMEVEFFQRVLEPDGSFGFLKARVAHKGVTLGHKIAVYSDGRTVPIAQAEREEREAYRARYGALSWPLARMLHHPQSAQDDAWREADEPGEFILWAKDEARADELATLFEGVVTRTSKEGTVLMVVRARPSQILAHAHHDSVSKIEFDTEPVHDEAPYAGVQTETAAHYTLSHEHFNQAQGNYADLIHVGIQEGTLYGTQLRGNHEAFKYAHFIYHDTVPPRCTFNGDCLDLRYAYGYADCENVFGNNICVAPHGTGVASRIVSSVNGTRHHASDIEIFVDNMENHFKDAPSEVKSFEWFVKRKVYTINRSVVKPFADYDPQYGVIDWYARAHKMRITLAAGNFDPGSSKAIETARCHSLNAMCVGSVNASGTYGSDQLLDDTLAPTSSWRNPPFSMAQSHQNPGSQKEAERPDFVTEGDDAWLATASNQWRWERSNGTSYAAPTVAGLVALLDACRLDAGYGIGQRLYRSLFRTSSYRRHLLENDPNKPVYPTPSEPGDAKVGTGMLTSDILSRWCKARPGEQMQGEGDDDSDMGYDEGSWNGQGEEIPSWTHTPQQQEPVTDNIAMELGYLRRQSPSSTWVPIRRFGQITNGRLRTTLSLSTCPQNPSTSSNPTLAPANDLDLAACSESQKRCYGVSESFDDTNEGFDVLIPGQVDDLTLYVLGPSLPYDCNGSTYEPFTASFAIWH